MHEQAGNIPSGWAYVLPTEVAVGICLPGRHDHGVFVGEIHCTRRRIIYQQYRSDRRCGAICGQPWGFFDMHGNVWEWTADWYGDTVREHRLILRDRLGLDSCLSGWFLEHGGTACVRPTARTHPRAPAHASASVSVSNSSELGTEG